MSLRDALVVYTNHRLSVTLRRTRFQHRKASERLHLVLGLLIAIADIDDVIAIIRGSDDVAQARAKLIEVFDLSESQANYILDLQLRRLTKFSRLELETERDDLQRRIDELAAIIGDDAQLRAVVARELDAVAKTYGTPRRTVLLAGGGAPVSAAGPLEIADDPCVVMLSSAGLLARADTAEPLPVEGRRAQHDVIVSAVRTTARGEYGVLTSAGRVLRAHAIELPSVVVTAEAPSLKGGARVSELITLAKGEHVVGLTTLTEATSGWALGTAQGVVKRVVPEIIGKEAWEIIRLEPGDHVVGAVELGDETQELVFVTSDAQLLHFPASAVRPQGRAGGGVAGIKLADGAKVVFFGASPGQDAVVATVSGSF